MYCIACMHVHVLSSQEPYKSDNYLLMYYSGERNAIGVKRKTGDKKQIFQFGGAKCAKGKEQLWKLGEDCLRKLDAGEQEEDVKTWVREAIASEIM